MPRAAITVKGDEDVARKLIATGVRAAHQRETFEREGREAQRRIGGVPVDTGRLAASVRGGAESVLDVDDDGYRIGSEVPYARFVFGGTKHMPARPPRVPGDLGRRAASAVSLDLRRV